MMPDPPVIPTDPRHGIASEEADQSAETLEPQDGDEGNTQED